MTLGNSLVNKMNLPKFSELNVYNRNKPCQEYPGIWTVDFGEIGKTIIKKSMHEAYDLARNLTKSHDNVYVYWTCSLDDPRQKEIWFNPHYKHGSFNVHSAWKLKAI